MKKNDKNTKIESDFNIIDIELINNNKFVVVMNKKPDMYIELIPFNKIKTSFPVKLENFLKYGK